MSEHEGEKSLSLGVPWGLRFSLGVSALFGIGVAFFTTISNGPKVSLYAAIGAFCLSLACCLLVWVCYRQAQKDSW